MASKTRHFLFVTMLWALCPALSQAADINIVEANGVKAWVVKDNILPIVSVEIAFRNAGSAHDPFEKDGTGYQVASMLNEGAGEYTSQEYQKLLEENAIGFTPNIDKDNFYISVKTLTENLPLAIDLTNLALTKPSFAENDLARIKVQTLTVLRKEDENEGQVAQKVFEKTMFGAHPYNRHKEGSAESLAKITGEDLHKYVHDNFAKDNIIISIVGDVDDASAKDIITKLTKDLPEKSATTTLPDFDAYAKGGVYDVKMNNPQTYIIFAEKGIKRQDKEYYAAYVLNHIFGGSGFSARLMTEVREKNGLAYGIGTGLQSMDKADLFAGVVSTKNQSVQQTIDIIQKEAARIAKDGVTPFELKDAKDYITGSFGLNLDKNENLAAFLGSMQLFGLPPEYLNKRNEYFNAVTIENVNAVAQKIIRPENLVFIKVGPTNTVTKP